MIDQLEFLVEEPSIAEVLQSVLPKVLPDRWVLNYNYFIRVHEGKQDLQRSIPRKIHAASHSQRSIGFVIIQDQDSNDCRALKSRLVLLCNNAMRNRTLIPYCVRIVCHELEAWYLGDMNALENVFPRFHAVSYQNRALFRNPDRCVNPKRELKRIVGDYSQIETARAIAPFLDIESNKSKSFQVFLEGVLRIARQ